MNISKTSMVEEASINFRLRKNDKTRNDLLHEVKHNDLMSEKYKRTWKYLSCFGHLLILASTITGCVSAFASLADIPVGITNSTVVINICAIPVGIKKY